MDLLQRIQRWYTLHCNGDWEHSYSVSIWHGISIQTLDNPGWSVRINLKETCMATAAMPPAMYDRTPTDWVSYKIENATFEAWGGPENLNEMLAYFLDTLLPEQADPTFLFSVHLPVNEYKGVLWLKAKARMKSENQLQVTSIDNIHSPTSLAWHTWEGYHLVHDHKWSSAQLTSTVQVGDIIEPHIIGTDEPASFEVLLVADGKVA